MIDAIRHSYVIENIIVDSNMVAEHNLIAGDIIEGLGLYDERQGLATLRYIQRINYLDSKFI